MLHELLKEYKLVLASASPRRLEIFKMMGLNPLVIPADVHEPIDHRPPWTLVKDHAMHKAECIRQYFDDNSVIVGADTLVYIDKTTLGKPDSKADAELYLRMLSGKTHTVYSGVCILWQNRKLVEYAKTNVTFCELTDEQIRSYINTREPMDKAGAYGIQGYGCQFITGIKGCYFNVMGFPVQLFYQLAQSMLRG
jgi:septum formation protein